MFWQTTDETIQAARFCPAPAAPVGRFLPGCLGLIYAGTLPGLAKARASASAGDNHVYLIIRNSYLYAHFFTDQHSDPDRYTDAGPHPIAGSLQCLPGIMAGNLRRLPVP